MTEGAKVRPATVPSGILRHSACGAVPFHPTDPSKHPAVPRLGSKAVERMIAIG